MTPPGKRYLIRVYRPGVSGAFVGTLSDADFDFKPFKNTINAGLGLLTLALNVKFDDFGENDLIAFNNRIKMYCIDGDSGPNGALIYDGFVLNIRPGYKGSQEKVEVDVSGYYGKFARWLLHSGNNVILQTDTAAGIAVSNGNPTPASVESVFKAAIDLYVAQATNPIINYTASSIGTTGVNMSYTFDKEMLDSSLNNILSAAPDTWYFYVGPDNVIQFKQQASTALHTFVLRKDFEDVDVQKNTDKLANNIVVHSSGAVEILSHYQDSSSQGLYDDTWDVHDDSSITDQATADAVGATLLANEKIPAIKTVVTITDNNLSTGLGYNIESIQPGDTCKFRGFNDVTSQTFTDNMLIVAVTYSPSGVVLELEERVDNIAVLLGQAIQAQETTNISNGLVSYQSAVVSPEVGKVVMHVAASVVGYLKCDGSAVSRSRYANLFSVIGTNFGSGDGSTTFNIPNFQDASPVGASGTKALGSSGGSAFASLAHAHTIASDFVGWLLNAVHHNHSGGADETGTTSGNVSSGTGFVTASGAPSGTQASLQHNHGGATGSALGSTSVQNPYQAINFFIRY